MKTWKLTLTYHGQNFHGWQIQPGLRTVQGTLAAALCRLTGEEVLPQGAGRTDTGVHALAQVCSFTLKAPLPAANLQRALNRVLPPDVRVLTAEDTVPEFHARHSARGKVYEYRIFERRPSTPGDHAGTERICSPFLAPFVWDCRWPLDLECMRQATQLLLGTQDFSAMAASQRGTSRAASAEHFAPATIPNPVKTIYAAEWTRTPDLLYFRIRGSGFLHHMVRNLVGTLVEVGRGSLCPHDLADILASRNRSEAGPTAPPGGLYLVEVLYPAQESPEVSTLPAHSAATIPEAL